jgi:hypothetical protein
MTGHVPTSPLNPATKALLADIEKTFEGREFKYGALPDKYRPYFYRPGKRRPKELNYGAYRLSACDCERCLGRGYRYAVYPFQKKPCICDHATDGAVVIAPAQFKALVKRGLITSTNYGTWRVASAKWTDSKIQLILEGVA